VMLSMGNVSFKPYMAPKKVLVKGRLSCNVMPENRQFTVDGPQKRPSSLSYAAENRITGFGLL